MSGSNKLQVSKEGTKKLDHLSARLNLRPNIICRLAIGKSLSIPSSVKGYVKPEATDKYTKSTVPKEFNRFTLTGELDDAYKIMIYQHELKYGGRKIPENQYYKGYFLNHLERGLDALYSEYQRVNSPIEFLRQLLN